MSRKIIISEIAEKRLESLFEYLMEEWSFKVKSDFIKELDKKVHLLTFFDTRQDPEKLKKDF